MVRKVVIDPSIAGVSGDMVLSALVDLGVDVKRIKVLEEVIPKYFSGVKDLSIDFVDVRKQAFRAKKLAAKFHEVVHHRRGSDVITGVKSVVEALDLDEKYRVFALNTVKSIVEVEAYLHGSSVEDVELHEAGSVDTVIDVVGVAIALQNLDMFNSYIVSLPIALGGGRAAFSHGELSAPAPATLELAKRGGALVFGGPIDSELATPTGVAILINLVKSFVKYMPLSRVVAVGYGAGERDFESVPNIMRIVVCEDGDSDGVYGHEEVAVVETDVDDVTGENIGYVVEKLFNIGAKDVSIVPLYMKKNRPGAMLKVLADVADVYNIIDTLIRELGTLGVRYSIYRRVVVPIREHIPVELDVGGRRVRVSIKIGRNLRGEVVSIKPEYEDIKKAAQELGIAVKDLMLAVYKVIDSYVRK